MPWADVSEGSFSLCEDTVLERNQDNLFKEADSRVEDGRGGFRFSVASGFSFEPPPQSGLP